MTEHMGRKIIDLKQLKKKGISFFIFLLIFSCRQSKESENNYNLISVEISNYKYVSAPFSGAGMITSLKFKNDTKKIMRVMNSYGNFQFILKNDTIKLGRKIAPRTFVIKKDQTLMFEFNTSLNRDKESYDFLINIIKNGTLYFTDGSNNVIPIVKSKDFHIDEGGKKGDLEW